MSTKFDMPLYRQTVIAIEQGRCSPSLEVAFRIAWTFRIPLDDVFHYPDEEGDEEDEGDNSGQIRRR